MPGRIIHFQQIAHGWRLGTGYVEQLLSFDPHQSRASDVRAPDPANKAGIPVIVGKDNQVFLVHDNNPLLFLTGLFQDPGPDLA